MSAHNTKYARRNLSNTPRWAWVYHKDNTTDQIYYLNNEPEAFSPYSGYYCSLGSCPAPYANDPYAAPDSQIDALLSAYWAQPDVSFYQVSGSERSIQAQALAYVFAWIKSNPSLASRGHTVIPPSFSDPRLRVSSQYAGQYAADFFQRIHNPPGNVITSGTGPAQPKITIAGLGVLHLHSYASPPSGLPCIPVPPPPIGNDDWCHYYRPTIPLESVAIQSIGLLRGVEWYRNTFNNGQALPIDILISEMGLPWQTSSASGNRVWAGGWENMRKGLSWWNSWLCWLLRRAPASDQFNLASGHTTYGCIHEATEAPYAFAGGFAPPPSQDGRTQWYVNCNSWDTVVFNGVPVVDTGLPVDGRYQGTFSALDNTPFGALYCNGGTCYWRRTPFGACYAVWSQTSNDAVTGDLSTGWTTNTQAGVIGDAVVWLPATGFNTIYIPVIKDVGTFPPANQISVHWIRDDGSVTPYTSTYIDMAEFDDGATYSFEGRSQYNYSAMVFPFVCYTSSPRNVRIRLYRTNSGANVAIGRPIVLPGMCSWMVTQ